MQTEKVQWGGLSAYVAHDLAPGEQPRLAVVLCHGYGAPGTDLVGLARPLLDGTEGDERPVFIFPAAPLDLAIIGMPSGRAWWPVDLDRLLNEPTPALLADFRRACPPGLPEARDKLVRLLAEAGQHFGLAADRFLLGGFSQGSMLATDVALRLKKPPAALCVLSGALIDEEEWKPLAAERGRLRVLQSHGRHDSILPFPMGEALRDLLTKSGLAVDFLPFAGDHEIPDAAVARLAKMIHELGDP